MKHTVVGSAVAIAWCAAAFAQQQPAPQPPAHNVFVLIGCLEAGADSTATSFTLTDASWIGQAAPARAGEAGAVGTSGQKASYELRAASGLNAQGLEADALKAHLGRRVEMIVRPIESPGPATPSLAGVQPAKPAERAPERYSVSEIKRVVGSCSRAG